MYRFGANATKPTQRFTFKQRREPFTKSLNEPNGYFCRTKTITSRPHASPIKLFSAASVCGSIVVVSHTRHYSGCEAVHRDAPNARSGSVLRLQEMGITLVAVDFDMTLVTTHTGGRWEMGAEDFAPLVRPELKELITALLQQTGIEVAIVSFSPEVQLIKEVLELSLGKDIASRIRVRGGNPLMFARHGGYGLGKQSHIASLGVSVKDLEKVLLIDDGIVNIFIGIQHGLKGIWPDTNHPTIMEDITELE